MNHGNTDLNCIILYNIFVNRFKVHTFGCGCHTAKYFERIQWFISVFKSKSIMLELASNWHYKAKCLNMFYRQNSQNCIRCTTPNIYLLYLYTAPHGIIFYFLPLFFRLCRKRQKADTLQQI